MPTLQPCGSGSGRAVADVPSAIVAAKHTNAQATARELIIVFVNFVFIVVVSFCLSFLVWPSVALHREELFLAVHPSTERKSARGYAAKASQVESWKPRVAIGVTQSTLGYRQSVLPRETAPI
jgi:hypothetical protein